MCRNIKTLFNFEPAATREEVEAASIQFVRKISGSTKPSQLNQVAFDIAVEEVSITVNKLLESLVTQAQPKDREAERTKARARSANRFGISVS